MSRLRKHENSTLFAKMRVYDGESLKESDPKARIAGFAQLLAKMPAYGSFSAHDVHCWSSPPSVQLGGADADS